jgi:hypothetical protein
MFYGHRYISMALRKKCLTGVTTLLLLVAVGRGAMSSASAVLPMGGLHRRNRRIGVIRACVWGPRGWNCGLTPGDLDDLADLAA